MVRDGVAEAAEESRRRGSPMCGNVIVVVLYISTIDVQNKVNRPMVCIIISRIARKVNCPLPPPPYHGLRAPVALDPDAAFLVSQNSSALLTVSNVGFIP
jgi:hypothetical protein